MAKEISLWERVVVYWIDSVHFSQPWWDAAQFIEHVKKPDNRMEMMSTGFKFYEDRQHVYLANSIDFAGDKLVHFGGVFSIPKGCISKIMKL
jgi:hypothetical protein